MRPIHAEYRITLSDYRMASYYGLFLRHRKALLALFVMLFVAVLYGLASLFGAGTANPLVFLLAAAYAAWGLALCAGTEKTIRAYLRSDGNLIGLDYILDLDETRTTVQVPAKRIRTVFDTGRMACAFELHAMFLLYSTAAEVYILPKRALSDEDALSLRKLLRTRLKDRFSTRFEKK
ncbi:MAG: YcxB family protein [Clostridia bacterium]|nr:YcxB family protein [Clostridia bacterium]